MEIKNKVFIVTGAGSGMGKELSIQLKQKGAKLALIDLNKESIVETQKNIGIENTSIHIIDITNKEAIEKLPDEIIKIHGAIDGIINNAGIIQPFVPVNNLNYESIQRVFNVNFYGMLFITKTFLPYLSERPEAHITNISSMGGFIPFPGQTIYSASKAAVKTFTEGLYAELKNTNIRVTSIMPGAINTNIAKNSGIEMETTSSNSNIKMLSAEKAASQIIRAIEKNRFKALIGKDAKLLNFLYRLNPKMAVNLIVKKMGNIQNTK